MKILILLLELSQFSFMFVDYETVFVEANVGYFFAESVAGFLLGCEDAEPLAAVPWVAVIEKLLGTTSVFAVVIVEISWIVI